MDGERVLLERPHRMAGLPMGSLQACRDLDECELLIVRDSPGLINAAMRMRQTRPGMRLWVEAQDGVLLDGGLQALPKLPATEILSVLNGQSRRVAGHEAGLPGAPAAKAAQMPAGRESANDVQDGERAGADGVSPVAAGNSGVRGSFALVRALRSGIRQRQGSALLYEGERAVLAIDFSSAQVVPLLPVMQQGLAEAALWLGGQLP